MRSLLLLLPLTGCSALMVGELGYTVQTNGPLHGVSGALHAGIGVDQENEEEKPALGLGFSGRIRGYGRDYTTIEPGLHGYVLVDRGPISVYARAIVYTGLSVSGEGSGFVFSPTLQPGAMLCPESRVGLCGTVSLPFGFDVGSERTGFVAGISFGIGYGNVVGDL